MCSPRCSGTPSLVADAVVSSHGGVVHRIHSHYQGRNPAGQTGLFPQSYTSPTPPSSSTVTFPDQSAAESSPSDQPTSNALQTLHEESESVTGIGDSRHSPTESERRRKPSEGEVMMRATMTDVQRAWLFLQCSHSLPLPPARSLYSILFGIDHNGRLSRQGRLFVAQGRQNG